MSGEIVIWIFELDRLDEELDTFEPLLSDDERQRRARLLRPEDRRRFTATRGIMRRILGARTGQPPQSLAFHQGSYGKPALQGPGQPGFSLSHSGALGALGVSDATAFGVDIEQLAPIEAAVAEIAFSPSERTELAGVRPEEWLVRFYKSWTRREAVAKALGTGLAQPLDICDVTPEPQAASRLLRVTGLPEAPAVWHLRHFVPAAGYMGAVAVAEPDHSIVLRRWMPSAA